MPYTTFVRCSCRTVYSASGYGKATLIKINASHIKKLRESLVDDQHLDDQVWLYNDGCIPTSSASAMKQYLARVALLMKAKAVPPSNVTP